MVDSKRDVSRHTNKGNLLNKLIGDMREAEDRIAYQPAAYSPAAGLREVEVTIEVQDSGGGLIRVSDETVDEVGAKSPIREVTVTINSGTATGKRLQQGNRTQGDVDGSIVAVLEDGKATITVSAESAGTVVVGLTDSASTGLTVSSTATVTFS